MNFNYNTGIDQEVFIEEEIIVSKKKIKVRATTVAGDKKKDNEDSFAIRVCNDEIWIAVFDGTTSLKAIPQIKTSGARFASHYLKDTFYAVGLSNPTEVLLSLNKSLWEKAKSLGGRLSDTHSLPASMGTIVKIDMKTKKLTLAHVGDTYVIAYMMDDSSKVITDDKNKSFDDKMFILMRDIAKKKNISNRKVRENDRVKKALVEMFIERNNNPNGNGSGIINGDPNMEKYVYENSISTNDLRSILVASDGLELQGFALDDSKYRAKLFEVVDGSGFQEMITRKRKSEDSDPEWQNIRYKHSDDATGVYCVL